MFWFESLVFYFEWRETDIRINKFWISFFKKKKKDFIGLMDVNIGKKI